MSVPTKQKEPPLQVSVPLVSGEKLLFGPRELGRGGSGIVYEGQLDSFTVAVKTILPSFTAVDTEDKENLLNFLCSIMVYEYSLFLYVR